MESVFSIEAYGPSHIEEWNQFVADSKNATFLFDRRFMDYHLDRFSDLSLIIRDEKKHIVALLPGNFKGEVYYSHQGLTYGGFLFDEKMTASDCLKIFELVKEFLKEKGFNKFVYKAIPFIYHKRPSQEDLYALFRNDARLVSRVISSTINFVSPIPISVKRRQKLRKSEKSGLVFSECDDVNPFMNMVDENLRMRYGVGSVHTPEEMQLLRDRFPKNIRLFTADKDGVLMAGALVFITDTVVHTQYMCVNIEGRKYSALDFVIAHVEEIFKDTHQYFDFGGSTEDNGRYLNESLIYQKEGFGGRGVCYDVYEMKLDNQSVKLVEFDDDFVELSEKWLQDEYVVRLSDAKKFDKNAQKKWVHFFRNNPDKILVKGIEIAGNKVGGCGVKNITKCSEDGLEGEFWIYIGERDYIGRGFGKIIMKQLEAIARDFGIRKLWLKVLTFNGRAISLYKRMGYEGKEEGRYIVMHKTL